MSHAAAASGGDVIEATLRMGEAVLNAGNARGACAHFQSALAADPTNARALRGLTRAKLALGDLDDARSVVDELARVEPNALATHELRARTHLARRAYPLAAEDAQVMLRLAPRNASGFHILAAARIGQKRYREALAATQDGLQIAPGSPVLMAQSGYAKLELNGPRAARADMDEAFRRAPRDRYVRYMSAFLAMTRGDIARARELCAAILRENVNDRSALDLYVLCDGPFPVHRWATRWRYLCKSAGPLQWLVRALGWLVYMVVFFALGAATLGGAWIAMFGLRFWVAAEKKGRARRVRDHFAAPSVNN